MFFGIRVSVTFHLMFVHIILLFRFGLLSGHLLEKKLLTRLTICSLYILTVILVISRFGFEGWIWVLIALVPGHCIFVTFSNYLLWLYSTVCVGPGRKPRVQVFLRCGSIETWYQQCQTIKCNNMQSLIKFSVGYQYTY